MRTIDAINFQTLWPAKTSGCRNDAANNQTTSAAQENCRTFHLFMLLLWRRDRIKCLSISKQTLLIDFGFEGGNAVHATVLWRAIATIMTRSLVLGGYLRRSPWCKRVSGEQKGHEVQNYFDVLDIMHLIYCSSVPYITKSQVQSCN